MSRYFFFRVFILKRKGIECIKRNISMYKWKYYKYKEKYVCMYKWKYYNINIRNISISKEEWIKWVNFFL